ncbi:MAG: NUDIX hydrolase [Bdellovibrionota bacterium]
MKRDNRKITDKSNFKNKLDKIDRIDLKSDWKLIASESIHKTPWIEIKRDSLKTPDEKDYVYTYVKKGDFITAVVIDDNNEIYLVKQYRHPLFEYTIEVVQGAIEEGETPLDAAKREVREEIGVVANSFKPLLSNFITNSSLVTSRGNIFLVRDIASQNLQKLDASEYISIIKVPFKKALEMINDGTIKESYSILAILLASQELKF